MFKTYLRLTKPGVMLGNLLTTVAGYLLAAGGLSNWKLFVATTVGTGLVISSACVINNFLDQDIDAKMERTKSRPLITGEASGRGAVIFGSTLGLLGILILYLYTSLLVVGIGLIGFVVYVLFYGALSKRLSWHGTLVGSISGAMPILAGYAAARGRIDAGAVIVFLILFFWQMPEFYSISIYRRKEYKAAGIPVVSVVKGVDFTKILILIYTLAFSLSAISLALFGYTGIIYLVVMGALCLYWLKIGIDGLKTADNDRWARRMFKFSLVMILAVCALLPLGALLP